MHNFHRKCIYCLATCVLIRLLISLESFAVWCAYVLFSRLSEWNCAGLPFQIPKNNNTRDRTHTNTITVFFWLRVPNQIASLIYRMYHICDVHTDTDTHVRTWDVRFECARACVCVLHNANNNVEMIAYSYMDTYKSHMASECICVCVYLCVYGYAW